MNPATTNTYEGDPASNESIPGAPDSRGNMGKVFQGEEKVWDVGTRISRSHQ